MTRSSESQRVSHIGNHTSLLILDDLLDDLYRVVLESEAGSPKSPRCGSILRGVSAVALVVGWAMSVTASSSMYPNLSLLALGILLLGVFGITISGIWSAMRTVREWRTLEADTVKAVGRNMARWYDAICKIRKAYSYEQISFANQYVSNVATQARGRLSLVIGALEKVGVIPLLASAAVTIVNFSNDGTIPIVWCTAAAAAGLIYFFALRMMDVSFMLERFALILEQAAKDSQ